MSTKISIDRIDRSILNILQNDCRTTIKEIALQLNLSTTPIFERIKKLEKNRYIIKNVAVLNPELLDLRLTAFIHISVSDHSKSAIEQFVEQVILFPEVLECHHISGKSDFILKVILKDMERCNDFLLNKLSTVPNIANIETSFALSVKKESSMLPI